MKARRGSAVYAAALSGALFLQVVGAARADETIVVSPANQHGWIIAQEIPTGSGQFRLGPDTPPLGSGSIELTVDSTGREIIFLPEYLGVPFADITTLGYSTYNTTATGPVAISLQFQVDYDLTDVNAAFQGRLVFEPSNGGGPAVANGVWQTWDPLAGEWWASGAPGSASCPIGNPCTWAEVLAAFPNAGVHSTLGAVILKAGGPWAPSFVGSADALLIGTNGVNTTYDFELCTNGCDCNTNGVADDLDVVGGTSDDCNTNDVPDECDPDCNSNGIVDDCEIFVDCNTNGVIDTCEPDCDTDGVPDECEFAAGTAADCNENTIPDDCDIAAGTSQDFLFPLGEPDECLAPANDTCADATTVGVPSSTPGTTYFATPDNVAECGPPIESSGVWYTVIGTGRVITVSTCSAVTFFDTRISVYCGCPDVRSTYCCDPHLGIGCDDSACQATVCGIDPTCCSSVWGQQCASYAEQNCTVCATGDGCIGGNDNDPACATSSTDSTFSWCSLYGVEYKILVHGFGDVSSGPFTLTVTDGPELCRDFQICGPVGACCIGDTCHLNNEGGCELAGGEYVGDGSSCADSPCEREHPGWNWVDVGVNLTANQPTYWSVATGEPATGGVSPLTILDPANPAAGILPGRPATDGTDERMLRGFVVGWAVNANGEEIRWNHLKGDAVIVNYDRGAAWEYSAYAFQVVNPAILNGAVSGTPGTLFLNGVEYDRGYELLLLDFLASGTEIEGPYCTNLVFDTDLTLMPLTLDVRQESEGPVTTKASFTVWNQNETKLTGLDRCITCWDSQLVSLYSLPNHFLAANLQTDKGKAQIDGLASALCDVDFDEGDGAPLGADPRDVVSQAAPLLGVAVKHIEFRDLVCRGVRDNGNGVHEPKVEYAGGPLIGLGTESSALLADIIASPPPERPLGDASTVGDPSDNARPVRAVPGQQLPGGGQPPVALGPNDRASVSDKGSLLVFPKVELRWNFEGTQLIQDTFLDLTNDFPEDVIVQFYFVNGDPDTQ